MVRIVFFEPYPMGLGGNYLTQQLILERLDLTKFEPLIVAPMEGVAMSRFRAMGFRCDVVRPPQSLSQYAGKTLRLGIVGRIFASVDLLRYNITLFRYFKRNAISIVYANCVRAELCVGFAAILARVPTLLYVKGELANPFVDRLCLFLASKILFFCEMNRDDH